MAPLMRSHISPEVLINSDRVRELCEQTGDAHLLALVLTHLFFFYYHHSANDKGGTIARQALDLAERSAGEFQIFCGNFISGLLTAEKGNYLAALQNLERAAGVSQQEQDSIIADPSVALGLPNCIGHLATVCWILGYLEQAQGHAECLAGLLRQSLPPNAYAVGVHHLLTIRCDFLRDYRDARPKAEDMLERSAQTDGESFMERYG
jgi:hypothetical protein